jgi:site-specific DNA-methyltransferase (adenine-specific)
MIDVRCGDNLPLLQSLSDDSIDAVVSDPPAGIGFMGKDWDTATRDQFIQALWERMVECYRVLKPGGHMLIWALPRTSHWTMTAIESASFEIRDTIHHLQARGFPKNHDIAKAIDKKLKVKRRVVGKNPNHRAKSGGAYAGVYAGKNTGSAVITAATSPAAQLWEGWGTALKPAHEVWVLARKPMTEDTIAANVLRWGVGGLNIEASRITTDDKLTRKLGKTTVSDSGWKSVNRSPVAGKDGGRWPANVVLSHSEHCVDRTCDSSCPVGELDAQSGTAASRFFPCFYPSDLDMPFCYSTKPSKAEKGEATLHPTVKGVELMRWLCRLITPPAGVILDPYTGSGSTGVAAVLEGFHFIGFEMDPQYAAIAQRRIHTVQDQQPRKESL